MERLWDHLGFEYGLVQIFTMLSGLFISFSAIFSALSTNMGWLCSQLVFPNANSIAVGSSQCYLLPHSYPEGENMFFPNYRSLELQPDYTKLRYLHLPLSQSCVKRNDITLSNINLKAHSVSVRRGRTQGRQPQRSLWTLIDGERNPELGHQLG